MINARRELLSGDPAQLRNYLGRQRRDKRYDRLVMQAMRDGKPLSVADVDRITGRYKDSLLKLRGETIARTESITALRAGRHEGYQQLVESGAVRDDQIIRTWDATGDARTRPDHMAMEGQQIRGMKSLFTAPDGSLLAYPGDVTHGATARQTIQCRCIEKIRIKSDAFV